MAKRKDDDGSLDIDSVHIDPYRLDEEWREQPVLFRAAARKLAEAKERTREAKAALAVIKAEVKRAVRNAPERYGITGRITEDQVDCAVEVDVSYQRAVKAYSDAQYREDIFEADVNTLSHKKAALENSVILWCRDYGSTPRVGKEHDRAAHDKVREMEAANRWKKHHGGLGDD